MPGTEQLLIDRYFRDLLNRGDFSDAYDILAPDFVFYGPSTPAGLNAEAFGRYIREMRAAFSHKEFSELNRITEGAHTAVRFRMTGVQDGPYQGLPPLGGSIDVEGCDFIRIDSGRIAEIRAYFDLMAIIQKLLVPPPVRFFGQLMEHLWSR